MNAGDLTAFVHRELACLTCGEYLGGGIARKVFAHAFDPTLVIKFEQDGGSFQNVMEWQAWNRVKHTKIAKWFAPCVGISATGAVLIQRRTTIAGMSEYPDKLPSFLTDIKTSNYGMLDGRFVAHDYGFTLLMENGMAERMRKVKWRNAQGNY